VSGLLVMALVKMLPKLKRSKKQHRYKESEALKILYPHINESKEIEAMVRKLYAKKAGKKEIVIDKKELNALIDQVAY
jgi:nicotinate-nucleotide pyrophosphorylase